ncbi:hypothetical protein, partial [Pseudomonas syringae group genomosp. 3]|uniref:hypothetical protein n=1 Tax=Pseudomonas syringae group genomosp. 3 TaxID=251701 RepID=UPI000EFFB160
FLVGVDSQLGGNPGVLGRGEAMRECREVSGRSQAFIVFISVFVMKINYTKTRYKQIYENKFLFVLCCAVLCRVGAGMCVCHVSPALLFRSGCQDASNCSA